MNGLVAKTQHRPPVRSQPGAKMPPGNEYIQGKSGLFHDPVVRDMIH